MLPRPLSLGDVLDGAFRLFRASWRAAIILTAVLTVPYNLVSSWAQRDLLTMSPFDIMADPFAFQEVGGAAPVEELLGVFVTFAYVAVIWPVLVGALAVLGFGAFLGRELTWGQALRAGARRGWALIGAWALSGLAVLAPIALAFGVLVVGVTAGAGAAVAVGVLLVLAGLAAVVAIGALFAAAAPAAAIEERGPVAALGRSARLVRRRFWPVLGVLLVSVIVVSFISLGLSAVPSLLAPFTGPAAWVVVAAGSTAASLVTTPFFAYVLLLILLDLRIRIEGYDLALAAGATDPTAARPPRQPNPGDAGGPGGRPAEHPHGSWW